MTTATVDVDDKAGAIDRPTAGRRHWVRRSAYVWAPLLVLLVLAAPSVPALIPASQDYLDEIYQPLQALKFFKTRGQQFHKYGPLPNFVLAPGYGASLAYWKVTGAFSRPSDSFPYGFKRPLQQIGFLILQGRMLFLVIGVIALATLAQTLRRVTDDPPAVGFALLFCVATNYMLAYELPSPRPDSPMLAFAALALACYVRAIFDGLTVRRGVWMSIWAVFAVSSKELAAPLFVLPYLGLIALAWREHRDPAARRAALRTVGITIAAGVTAYALVNIVYAPHTWLERMRYWLLGPGIDAGVWGKSSFRGRVLCVVDNFGPAGTLVAAVAVAAFVATRPRRWVMLLLPALSVALLGLSRIQYAEDRFYTILCLALFPVVAVGLSELLRRVPRHRAIAWAALLVLGALNFWYATLTWHALHSNFYYQMERHALAHVPRDQSVYALNEFPYNKGSTRMEWLGYRHDTRSVQQIARQRTDMPQWIYTTGGKLGFLEDARTSPARAAMLRADKTSPFDIDTWPGLQGMGYRLSERIVPEPPAWYPFKWMPAVKEWEKRKELLVYQLSAGATATTPATRTSP